MYWLVWYLLDLSETFLAPNFFETIDLGKKKTGRNITTMWRGSFQWPMKNCHILDMGRRSSKNVLEFSLFNLSSWCFRLCSVKTTIDDFFHNEWVYNFRKIYWITDFQWLFILIFILFWLIYSQSIGLLSTTIHAHKLLVHLLISGSLSIA